MSTSDLTRVGTTRQHVKGERTVANVLRDRLQSGPDTTFLRTDERDVSLAEVERETNRIANGLSDAGVARGDTVLIMLPNGLEILYVWIGLSKIGGVEVPVNIEYRGSLLTHVANLSGARTMVIHQEYLDRLAAVLPELTCLHTVYVAPDLPDDLPDLGRLEVRPFADLVAASDTPPEVDVSYRELAAIMFTSGTTGPSKGVMITHAHAYEYAYALIGLLDLRPGDVYFAPLPLFHVAGQWATVYASLIGGAIAVVSPRFSVSTFWDDVRRYGGTTSFLLGAMANFLYRQPPSPRDRDHPLERVLVVPLPAELEEFRERFGVRVSATYGSSESGVPIVGDFDVSDPLACGTAREGYDLALVDENDERVPVGKVGELLIRPREPWVTMRGYVNMPEATAEAYRNAWLHTGDAFYQDEAGVFYFVDRLKDAIRRRGENISSFEVEREVNAHPDVLESAAFPVPAEWGEDEVMVVVAPRAGTTIDPATLQEFVAERLPRFMVPRYIRVVEQMPKTPTGKIEKYKLRANGTENAWQRSS